MHHEDKVTISLTRREAELVSTLICQMNGRLQVRPTRGNSRTFGVWNRISNAIAQSMGVIYSVPSAHVDRLISPDR